MLIMNKKQIVPKVASIVALAWRMKYLSNTQLQN